jgi:fermentation-respiration switch protein FrsA (DUF1100 family)
MKMLLLVVLASAAGFFLITLYVRMIERSSLFYPYRPSGLDSLPPAFQDVFFRAADGVKLHGWHVPAKDGRYTILFCHGNAGNIGHRVQKIELFTGLGMNVFIFDYRGYGKSEGSPSERGLYADALGAYGWLTASGVKPQCLWRAMRCRCLSCRPI